MYKVYKKDGVYMENCYIFVYLVYPGLKNPGISKSLKGWGHLARSVFEN